MTLGTRLQRSRRKAGKTLEEAAADYGVSTRTYIRWEQGGRPDTANLLKLSNLFGIPPQMVLESAAKR